jgi:hypothetical protein
MTVDPLNYDDFNDNPVEDVLRVYDRTLKYIAVSGFFSTLQKLQLATNTGGLAGLMMK